MSDGSMASTVGDLMERVVNVENRVTVLETHHLYAKPAIDRLTEALEKLEHRLATVESKVLMIVAIATGVITLAQIALRFVVT